jgi:hypothetical protein
MSNLKLNTVYDYWNGDKPILNGKFQYPQNHFWDIEEFVLYYINSFTQGGNKITINNCKLSDISKNPNQKYYYFICHATMNIDDILRDNLIITDEIKEHLRLYSNFNIVFFSHHESDSEEGFNVLNNSDLPKNQIYIINNNFKLKEYVNKHNSKIKVYSIMYLPTVVSSTLEKFGGIEFNIEKKEKFFMCFNRGPKLQRLSLLVFMLKNNLLNDTNWSLIPMNFPNYDYQSYSEIFELDDIENYKNEIEYFSKLKLKVSDYEKSQLSFSDNNEITVLNPKYANLLMPPEIPHNYENSYVNIVTETCFFNKENVIQITEKSFKPFFYYQFPMILATHQHIKSLKQKYNFDFFDDVIDHSYDDELDHKKRFNKFVKEIKRLYDNRESLMKFYRNNQNRFEENKNKMIDIAKSNSDYLFIRSLLD